MRFISVLFLLFALTSCLDKLDSELDCSSEPASSSECQSDSTINSAPSDDAESTAADNEYTDGDDTGSDSDDTDLDSDDTNTDLDSDDTDTEITTPESRDAWVLDASNNSGDISLAIDSSTATRWTTNEDQQDGQWITVDLSRVSSFNTITLDSDVSPNDFPISYEVYLSDDGDSWNELIASGSGGDSTTVISLPDVESRYIKIEQTGSSDSYYWSIHELYITYDDSTDSDPDYTVPDWTVSSLEELQAAILLSNQVIVLRASDYNMTALDEGARVLDFSGSNNTVYLVDVYVEVPVGSTERVSYIEVGGANNIIVGGEFEDTYYNDIVEVTDFVSYNDDSSLAYGLNGDAVMTITGNDNIVDGLKLIIRGSFPYGYGSIFGINQINTFGLNKRCGILINGDSNTIQNAEIQQRAFCHGIYMQSPADNTLIKNVLVEGRVRATNDMLAEGSGSLPYSANYTTIDGDAIAADEVHSLSEDGIRVYTDGGSVTVEDSVVKKMRGGIRLYLASAATVSGSTAIDNGSVNWNLPNGGTVTNSSGNFTNGPLSDFRLSKSNQNLELTIIQSPEAVGAHNIADVLGNNHTLVFHRVEGAPRDTDEARVIMVSGNNSSIINETEYEIVLAEGTSGNTVISAGEVTDYGSNTITFIEFEL